MFGLCFVVGCGVSAMWLLDDVCCFELCDCGSNDIVVKAVLEHFNGLVNL